MATRSVPEPPPTPGVTSEQVRDLLKQMSFVLNALSDGRVAVSDGKPIVLQQASRPYPHRMTIREMRATAPDMPMIQTRPRPTQRNLKPRCEYQLIGPANKTIDTNGLTPAALAILRLLARRTRASIKAMVEEFQLSRSTIANALTELRKRELVESVQVS